MAQINKLSLMLALAATSMFAMTGCMAEVEDPTEEDAAEIAEASDELSSDWWWDPAPVGIGGIGKLGGVGHLGYGKFGGVGHLGYGKVGAFPPGVPFLGGKFLPPGQAKKLIGHRRFLGYGKVGYGSTWW
jgi:hypothetical protein